MIEKLKAKARIALTRNDEAHGYRHSERVENLAITIGQHEGGDSFILSASAYLHDWETYGGREYHVSEAALHKIRDEMVINNQLDSAKRFYYQRKTCFRGMLRYNQNGKFNIPFGKYESIDYEDLLNEEYEKVLKNTEILNADFNTIFNEYNCENNFMFLDPPYDSEFTDYGYCKFGKEEHKVLAECFKTTKIKCLMVIGKTPFIEELYKDYIVEEYSKKYKFKLYANRIGDEINTSHLVIKNY